MHYETRCGGLIKLLWHDGQGMCFFAKRVGTRALSVAVAGRWRRDDYGGTAWVPVGRHRLAHAASDLASTGGGLIVVF
jgi:hypothetical protein